MVWPSTAQPGGDMAGTGAPRATKENGCGKIVGAHEGLDSQLKSESNVAAAGACKLGVQDQVPRLDNPANLTTNLKEGTHQCEDVEAPLLDTTDAIAELEERLLRLEQRHMGTPTQMQEMAAATVNSKDSEQSVGAIDMNNMPNVPWRHSGQASGLQLHDVYDVDWVELQKTLQERKDERSGRARYGSRHSLPARLPVHQAPSWPVPAELHPPQPLPSPPARPPPQPKKPLQQKDPELSRMPQSSPPVLFLQPTQGPSNSSVGRRRRASAPCDLEHLGPMEAPRGKSRSSTTTSLRFCEPEVIFHETYDSPCSARIEPEGGSSSQAVERTNIQSPKAACQQERVQAEDTPSSTLATPSSSRTTPSPYCGGKFYSQGQACRPADQTIAGAVQAVEGEDDGDEDISDGLEELMVSAAAAVNEANQSHRRSTEALPCLADDDFVDSTEPAHEVDIRQHWSHPAPMALDSGPSGSSAASVFSQREASPVCMDRIGKRNPVAAPSSWTTAHDANVSDFKMAASDRSGSNCWSSRNGGFTGLETSPPEAYPQSSTMPAEFQPCIQEGWPPRPRVTSRALPFEGYPGAAHDRFMSKAVFVDNGDLSGGCEPWGVKNRLRHLFDTCDLDGDGRASRRDLFKACRSNPEFFRLPQAFSQGDVAGGDRAVSWDEFWERFSNQAASSTDSASRITVSPRLGDVQPFPPQQTVEAPPAATEEPWTAGRSPPQQEKRTPVVDEHSRAPAVPLLERPVQEWGENDVAEWLAKLSAVPPDIVEVVRRHAINGPVLLSLSDQDLRELGIEKFGHRRLLALAAQELRAAVENHRRSRDVSPGHSARSIQPFEATRPNHPLLPLAPALEVHSKLPYVPMPEQINPGRSPVSSVVPSLEGGDVALSTSPQPPLPPPLQAQRAISYNVLREVSSPSAQSSPPGAQVRVVQSPGNQQRGGSACPVAPNIIPVRHMHHAASASSLGQRHQKRPPTAALNAPLAPSVTVSGTSSPGRAHVARGPKSRAQRSPGQTNVGDNALPRSLSPTQVGRTNSPIPTGPLQPGLVRVHRQRSPPHQRRQERVWRG